MRLYRGGMSGTWFIATRYSEPTPEGVRVVAEKHELPPDQQEWLNGLVPDEEDPESGPARPDPKETHQ